MANWGQQGYNGDMQDAKEEVRSRLNIEDVIGEYVQLKRAGRNFKGLSPFSGERTPSFFVSPDKHIWHDFSSNKGGDVFAFVMEVEGMDFRQSLEHLARKAGVDLSVYENKGDQEIAKKKKRLFEAHELAAKYYQQSLLKNQHAIDYVFKKRGLSKQIVQEFMIGYAPTTGDALVQFLLKKGFTKNELADGGLTNRYGGDMFRGRMTVPLMDPTGRVIGFTARIIVDDPKAPKYLNTPQTLLYDKGRHVFGLSQAKETIRTSDYAVVVEGNLDVVSSHQAAIRPVVATAGTAMTEHHLRALARLSGNVRLAFDGDKAGLAATERAIPIAQAVGVDLTIITLKGDAKDPDELIQQDPKLWQDSIDTAQPVVDWVLQQYQAREDLTTAAGKRRFTTEALNVVRTLRDAVERDHYLQHIGELTGASLDALVQKLNETNQPEEKRLKPTVRPTVSAGSDEYSYQDSIMTAAVVDPAVHDLFAEVTADMFAGEDRQKLADYIIRHPGVAFKEIPKELQSIDTYVKIVLLKADTRYASWSEKDRYFETATLLRRIITEHKKHQKEQLDRQLREAELEEDEAKIAAIREQLTKLIKEIHSGR